jgi:hypothetical protein
MAGNNNNSTPPHDVDKKEAGSLVDWMVKSLTAVRRGRVLVGVGKGDDPAIEINKDEGANRINIDILNPDIINLALSSKSQSQEDEEKIIQGDQDHKGTFDKIKDSLKSVKEIAGILADDEIDIFDKLDDMRDFARKLTENDMTLVLLRKGREAIVLGKDAKPSVSRIVSGSDDVQLKSIKEVSKLAGDLTPEG